MGILWIRISVRSHKKAMVATFAFILQVNVVLQGGFCVLAMVPSSDPFCFIYLLTDTFCSCNSTQRMKNTSLNLYFMLTLFALPVLSDRLDFNWLPPPSL